MKNKYHNLSRELITAKRPNQMLISAAITAIVFTATPSFAEQVPSVLPANVSALNSTSPSARVEQLNQEFMSLKNKLTASNVFYLGSQADASALHRKFRVTLITPSQLEALGTSSPIIIMADSRHVKDWKPLVKQIKAGSYVVAIGDTRPLKVLLSGSDSVTTALDNDSINEKVFGFHQTADKGDFEYSSLETDRIAAAEAAFNWARRNLAEQNQPIKKVLASSSVDTGEVWEFKEERIYGSPSTDWKFSNWSLKTKYYKLKNDTSTTHDWWYVQVNLQSDPNDIDTNPSPYPNYHTSPYTGCKYETQSMQVVFERKLSTSSVVLDSYGPKTTNHISSEGWKIGGTASLSGLGLSSEIFHSRSIADASVVNDSNNNTQTCMLTVNIKSGTDSSRHTSDFEPNCIYKIPQNKKIKDVIKQSNFIILRVDHLFATKTKKLSGVFQ